MTLERTVANLSCRLLSLAVAGAMALAPLPGWAGNGPAEEKKEEAPAAEAPATVSGTVALLRFEGQAKDLRTSVQQSLQGEGFTTKSVALTITAAAKKVKCGKGNVDDACLAKLGKWLKKSKKTASDYVVYGGITEVEGRQRMEVVLYDIAKATRVKTFSANVTEGDFILPLTVPKAVGTALAHHVVPPSPASEDEEKILAELDEPSKTPEEIEAEKQAIADAQRAAEEAQQQEIDTEAIAVDLKKDFKEFCRKGPRQKRESRDDPRDLRPSCKRGPFWGYWQPRAYVAMGLTIGAGLTSVAFYALALVKRGAYSDAVDELEAFEKEVEGCGDPKSNPYCTSSGGQTYAGLATDVSKANSAVRESAIIGDAMLGATVLLAAVTGIIIFQDRRDAKKYIKTEKGLRAISNVQVGPMVGKRAKGMSLGFSF